MAKRIFSALVATMMLVTAAPSAHAGLDAPINLDNPRVVPIWGAMTENQGASNRGWWSGFLHSPRIVLTAAHSTHTFDANRNRQINEPAFIMVGLPNSNVKNPTRAVKVIKSFVGDYKLGKTGFGLNDFIVYVLEKDLAPIQPSKLMTSDIEKELLAAKAELSYHGYGEYRDRCAPGQQAPCQKDWNNPNQSGSDLPRINKINLAPLTDFTWMNPDMKADLQFESLISNHKGCSGDSGGPITTVYEGELLYVGQGLNGANVYACGAGNAKAKNNEAQSLGYFSPVYKHFDLISQAEAYVKETTPKQSNAKVSITCAKGKMVKKISGTNPKCPAGYKKK